MSGQRLASGSRTVICTPWEVTRQSPGLHLLQEGGLDVDAGVEELFPEGGPAGDGAVGAWRGLPIDDESVEVEQSPVVAKVGRTPGGGAFGRGEHVGDFQPVEVISMVRALGKAGLLGMCGCARLLQVWCASRV